MASSFSRLRPSRIFGILSPFDRTLAAASAASSGTVKREGSSSNVASSRRSLQGPAQLAAAEKRRRVQARYRLQEEQTQPWRSYEKGSRAARGGRHS